MNTVTTVVGRGQHFSITLLSSERINSHINVYLRKRASIIGKVCRHAARLLHKTCIRIISTCVLHTAQHQLTSATTTHIYIIVLICYSRTEKPPNALSVTTFCNIYNNNRDVFTSSETRTPVTFQMLMPVNRSGNDACSCSYTAPVIISLAVN